jgi:hypothetical protein
VVFVDHAAEYAVASDRAIDGHGDCPVVVVGCVLVSGLVWPMSVVVLRVFGQHPGGVVLAVDQDVVGAFGANGADEPLGVTVRAGSSWRVS